MISGCDSCFCCTVAGLGSGAGAALFADIARVTSVSERTAVMSVFMSVRQIGLLIGMSHCPKLKINNVMANIYLVVNFIWLMTIIGGDSKDQKCMEKGPRIFAYR